jgi:hypothetical protein
MMSNLKVLTAEDASTVSQDRGGVSRQEYVLMTAGPGHEAAWKSTEQAIKKFQRRGASLTQTSTRRLREAPRWFPSQATGASGP